MGGRSHIDFAAPPDFFLLNPELIADAAAAGQIRPWSGKEQGGILKQSFSSGAHLYVKDTDDGRILMAAFLSQEDN